MHEIVIMYLCFNFAICEHILLGPTPSKRKCRQHTDFEKKVQQMHQQQEMNGIYLGTILPIQSAPLQLCISSIKQGLLYNKCCLNFCYQLPTPANYLLQRFITKPNWQILGSML